MSFPRYESYKDSGAAWLIEVPSHWTLRRLGYSFTERREKASDKDFLPLSVTKTGVVPQLETAAKSDDGDNRKKVLAGDFVINSRSDRKGSSGLSSRDGSVSLIYTVLEVRSGLDKKYAELLLRSRDFQEEFYRFGKGIVADLWSTSYSEMKNIVIPVPPLQEQNIIVEKLSGELSKIDALIEVQQRLMALLKEQRQAVISHALTKGLDLTAPMKPSGVGWLGEVPAHWTLKQIKHVCRSLEQGWSPQCESRMADWAKGEWGVLKVGCVNSNSFDPSENKALPIDEMPRPELSIKSGDMLISRANTRDLVGSASVAEEDYPTLLLCDKLYRLRLDETCSAAYLCLILRTRQMRSQIELAATGASSSMLNIAQSTIRELVVCLPDRAEQEQILGEIASRVQKLDLLSAEAEHAVNLLAERRASLISHAVTGKIDVRGWCAADVLETVSASIIYINRGSKTFGRVKYQKLLYLAEVHAGIDEIGGKYVRHAAGPYDGELINSVERRLERLDVITTDQPGGRGSAVSYTVNPAWKPNEERLKAMLGSRLATFKSLSAKLVSLDTRSTEAVATLYAVWNDFLIEEKQPDDLQIVSGFLNDWHWEKRKKFNKQELVEWLGWMRRNGLVPVGRGPKTSNGRLF